MLAISRGLRRGPGCYLLDEPSLGLARCWCSSSSKTIERINREDGTAILPVEQNANMALRIAHGAT
jgi:branched-chain amino acid transport system ATP-binding protein